VSITQVDERWVPEDHPDSNSHLIRECLLRGLAAEANFVSMKTAGDDVFAAEAECRQRLSAFSGGADVVVLGMGDDGHTASFFPAAETLHLALDPDSSSLCLGLRPPLAPHDRMTLSLAVILRSRHVYLHVTGESKRLVLDRAREEGPETELPIRAVLRRFPELEIYFAA
jgi:6-phosphogluconolactonase